MLLGLCLLLLPVGIRIFGGKGQVDVIATYEQKVEKLNEKERLACLQAAEAYNARLFSEGWLQKEEYSKQLNLAEGAGELTGIMGSLTIPKIHLKLPIRHGTSEAVLASCVGHLLESSLPVGGENTHSVLTSHRGVPNAQLFTRLDELEKGDVFSIAVCGEVLNYEVCRIQTVKPEEVQAVKIQEGRDLVSLVTCTPYGLNTHRLIVTGERVQRQSAGAQTQEMQKSRVSKWDAIPIFVAGIFLLAGKLPAFLRRKRQRHHRKEKRHEKVDGYSSRKFAMRAADGGTRGKGEHRNKSTREL
ncbi:MAG: class C sortase [Faecalimonas sp.]|nr:class C sortase [Faecalimonas sp.]